MAETPATPTGTSSTPTAAPATGSTPPTPPVEPTAPQTPSQTPPSGEKPAVDPAAKPTEGETPKTDDKPATDPKAPLYTLPDDIKFQQPALTAIDTLLQSKLVDGKVVLTPQEVMDHFAQQARDGQARWEQALKDTDAANKAVCEKRFTPAQLTAAETGVAFLSSHDPAFRDWAKAQLNNPVFVNAMRDIGERLAEDSLDPGAAALAPAPQKRSLSARMGYTKQ